MNFKTLIPLTLFASSTASAMVGLPVTSRSESPGALSTVSLFTNPIRPSSKAKCSGVVIARNKILTAGHCKSFTGRIVVSFGLHERSDRTIMGTFNVHPNMTSTTNLTFTLDGDTTVAAMNDIAIVTLDESIPSHWDVQVAEFSNKPSSFRSKLYHYGFGTGWTIDPVTNQRTEDYAHATNGIRMRKMNSLYIGQPRLGTDTDPQFYNNTNPDFFAMSKSFFSHYGANINNNGSKVLPYLCNGDSGSGVFDEENKLKGIFVSYTDKTSQIGVREDNCETSYAYSIDVNKYQHWIKHNTIDQISYPADLTLKAKAPTGTIDEDRNNDGRNDFHSNFFLIKNESDDKVLWFYAAPNFSNSWGFKIDSEIQAGSLSLIRITDRTCHYSFRVVREDKLTKDLYATNDHSNICEFNTLTLQNR